MIAIAVAVVLGLLAPVSAHASLSTFLRPLFTAPTPPSPVPAAPIVALPAGPVQGTVIMIHGGGWQGPGLEGQRGLVDQPGQLFLQRGWRVISLDYRAGTDGLVDVIDAVSAELAAPAGGPLCLYGESSGAQLVLIAASRLAGIDCVAVAGAPTDLASYLTEAQTSGDAARDQIADRIRTVFGPTPDPTLEPVDVAQSISADVLMMRQADDDLMPVEQLDRFLAARPTTQSVTLEAAPQDTAETSWLHGTLSDAGRATYDATLGSFADRAVAADVAERLASMTRCVGVTRSVGATDGARLARALACLGRRDDAVGRKTAQRTETISRRLRGNVNGARVWALLRRSRSGRRALAALAAGQAKVSVHTGDPSRVIFRIQARSA